MFSRHIHHLRRCLVCVFVVGFFLGATGFAQDSDSGGREAVFGVKAGLLGSGTMSVGSGEIEKEATGTFGLFADMPSSSPVSFGLYFDFHKFDTPVSGDSEYMINAGIAGKYTFSRPGSALDFRPGIGAGYGSLKETYHRDRTHYLILTFSLETIYHVSRSTGLIAEIGVMAIPVGGNTRTEISNGGLLVLRGGLAF